MDFPDKITSVTVNPDAVYAQPDERYPDIFNDDQVLITNSSLQVDPSDTSFKLEFNPAMASILSDILYLTHDNSVKDVIYLTREVRHLNLLAKLFPKKHFRVYCECDTTEVFELKNLKMEYLPPQTELIDIIRKLDKVILINQVQFNYTQLEKYGDKVEKNQTFLFYNQSLIDSCPNIVMAGVNISLPRADEMDQLYVKSYFYGYKFVRGFSGNQNQISYLWMKKFSGSRQLFEIKAFQRQLAYIKMKKSEAKFTRVRGTQELPIREIRHELIDDTFDRCYLLWTVDRYLSQFKSYSKSMIYRVLDMFKPLFKLKKMKVIPDFPEKEIKVKESSIEYLKFSPDDFFLTEKKLKYEPRKNEITTNIHFGQLKLLMSEIQFLTRYYNGEKALVVYAGAAPGQHFPLLSKYFPNIIFHLHDPAPFRIGSSKKIKIFNQYFTDEVAEGYRGKKNIYFISDIRRDPGGRDTEKMIIEDNEWQKTWLEIIGPKQALLKFHIPYPGTIKSEKYKYLDGEVYAQCFAPRSSTETRLVPIKIEKSVSRRESSDRKSRDSMVIKENTKYKEKKWSTIDYEQRASYFNRIIREKYKYFNPINQSTASIMSKILLNDFDSTLMTVICIDYLKKHSKKVINPRNTLSMLKEILNFLKKKNLDSLPTRRKNALKGIK
jgi:hypothetical protein